MDVSNNIFSSRWHRNASQNSNKKMTHHHQDCHDSSLIRALGKKDWELCRTLMTCNERSYFPWIWNHGWSAFHWACQHNALVDVVFATCREMRDSLVNNYSEGWYNNNSVLIMDWYSYTPLHLACWYALEVIAFVINLLPISTTNHRCHCCILFTELFSVLILWLVSL